LAQRKTRAHWMPATSAGMTGFSGHRSPTSWPVPADIEPLPTRHGRARHGHPIQRAAVTGVPIAALARFLADLLSFRQPLERWQAVWDLVERLLVHRPSRSREALPAAA